MKNTSKSHDLETTSQYKIYIFFGETVNTSVLLKAFNYPVQRSKNNVGPCNEKGYTENFTSISIWKNWGSTIKNFK